MDLATQSTHFPDFGDVSRYLKIKVGPGGKAKFERRSGANRTIWADLMKLQDLFGLSKEDVAELLGISGSTFKRRCKEKVLQPSEVDQLVRLQEVARVGLKAFHQRHENFGTWLQSQNVASLNFAKPASLVMHELGRMKVIEVLRKIQYGTY